MEAICFLNQGWVFNDYTIFFIEVALRHSVQESLLPLYIRSATPFLNNITIPQFLI